jgi:hypothetical protein
MYFSLIYIRIFCCLGKKKKKKGVVAKWTLLIVHRVEI